MNTLPNYVSLVFILTTFATIAFLLRAIRSGRPGSLPTNLFFFLLALWIIFQAILAIRGFFQDVSTVPPRLVLFAIIPAILLIAVYFVFFRVSFVERLPLQTLTLLHIVRIPVEIVLLWLFFGQMVPQMMTFEGRNFDILSGILAPIVYWAAFRGGRTRRGLLIAYNVVGLILLANIVSIAALSLPSPIQQLNFDQPNIAVLQFPFIWLPSIIVPIVLFAHLASLWKLLRRRIS